MPLGKLDFFVNMLCTHTGYVTSNCPLKLLENFDHKDYGDKK